MGVTVMSMLGKIRSWVYQHTTGKQVTGIDARPDLVRHAAHSITDFYSVTYPYVFSISWHCYDNEFWSMFKADPYQGGEFLAEWCRANCVQRFRWDYHRVSVRSNIQHGAHLSSDYVFDEMGGGDVLFFAFENSQDFCLFSLRWGYVAN